MATYEIIEYVYKKIVKINNEKLYFVYLKKEGFAFFFSLNILYIMSQWMYTYVILY